MAQFYLPTRVLHGPDIVKQRAYEFNGLGQKALIVMGSGSAVTSGAYGDVTQALQKERISYVYFNEVEPNPTVDTVRKAFEIGSMNSVDFVIGIGGGSPMDAAKAVAVLLADHSGKTEYLYEKDPNVTHLPLVLVPTTCGSGSEVTGVSVLTVPEKKTKKSIAHKVFAEIAMIDPKYLRSLSKEVLMNTAFDALSHMIESYVNTSATEFSRMCAISGMKKWAACRKLWDGRLFTATDHELTNLSHASVMAGMAIAQTGTGIPHALSYPLTYYLGIPHGKACAYFLAGFMDALNEHVRQQILDFAGFIDIKDFRKCYRYCCGGLEVADKENLIGVLALAAEELSRNPDKCRTAGFPVTMDVLKRIAFYEIQEPTENFYLV